MNNDYILNGEVARNRIALDIKYRKLNRSDIEQLIINPQITSAFIGSTFSKKKPMKDWNKSYLDELSYVAVAESFNRDYLLYLEEVADFVAKAKIKKIIIGAVIVVLVIITGFVVLTYVLNGGNI